MKQRNRARSSSLFLLELIIAILFFSACAAVCVQFFVKSHTVSQDSRELNFAVNECSTLAEIIQSSDTEAKAISVIKSIYPDSEIQMNTDDTKMKVFYDSDFEECTSNKAKYVIDADIDTYEGLISGNISAEAIGKTDIIYELEVKHNEKR